MKKQVVVKNVVQIQEIFFVSHYIMHFSGLLLGYYF